jgi:hypothetical protein
VGFLLFNFGDTALARGAGLMFLPRLYFRAKRAHIAMEHEAIVQAISNFRAETGLLPYELRDLQTRFDDVAIPERISWSPFGILEVRAGTPRIAYVFGEDFEGWSCHWQVRSSRK